MRRIVAATALLIAAAATAACVPAPTTDGAPAGEGTSVSTRA